MATFLLVIHLFIAAGLVGVILLQRSEGGALGMGGGGPGNLMSGRAAGNALTRATTALAVGFFATSLVLALVLNRGDDDGSVLDRVDEDEPQTNVQTIGIGAPVVTPSEPIGITGDQTIDDSQGGEPNPAADGADGPADEAPADDPAGDGADSDPPR